MVDLTLPAYQSEQKVTEAEIKRMSVEECLVLRREVQAELQRWQSVNPSQLTSLLGKISERLFEANYHLGVGNPDEAHEG